MKWGQQDILSSTPNGKNVFFRPPRDSTLHTIKRKKEKIKKGIHAQNMAMMMMPPTVIAIYHTDAGGSARSFTFTISFTVCTRKLWQTLLSPF